MARDFGFADQQGEACAEFAGKFHRAFELAGGGEFNDDSVAAEVAGDEARMAKTGFIHGGDEEIEGVPVFAGVSLFDRHHEAVFANGEADAGCRNATTKTFGEAIVAAATEDGILGTEGSFVDDLEGGACVVIETANHARIDGVSDATVFEVLANTGKVGARVFVEIVVYRRKIADVGLVFGCFGIEDAEGIGFETTLRIDAQLILDGQELFADRFDESGDWGVPTLLIMSL